MPPAAPQAREAQTRVALVITCRRPGLIRAGVRHPPVAVHAPGRFSAEQIAEMLDEPELTLVAGVVMAHENVAGVMRHLRAAAGLDEIEARSGAEPEQGDAGAQEADRRPQGAASHQAAAGTGAPAAATDNPPESENRAEEAADQAPSAGGSRGGKRGKAA